MLIIFLLQYCRRPLVLATCPSDLALCISLFEINKIITRFSRFELCFET